MCFLRLGRYYEKINDLEKSKRCYEKAFKLNSKNNDVIGNLSKIYKKQKDWVKIHTQHNVGLIRKTSFRKQISLYWST